jgi:SAM-dependent methyltransferase
MEAVRKLHNNCKRELIQKWVQRGESVLDCGCGRGGDWHKWKAVGAQIFAIDPDEESLVEAENRAIEMKFGVFFLGKGTIIQAAFAGPFDVVCYNFSIHYIMDDFENSIKAIDCAVKPGGYLIGITPDKNRAELISDSNGHYIDRLGNTFDIYQGGRRLLVKLTDGPFYADGPKDEPLLDSTILTESLRDVGFELVSWEPMLDQPNGLISDLYSKFVFRKLLPGEAAAQLAAARRIKKGNDEWLGAKM